MVPPPRHLPPHGKEGFRTHMLEGIARDYRNGGAGSGDSTAGPRQLQCRHHVPQGRWGDSSGGGGGEESQDGSAGGVLRLRDRVRHFTWTWFAMTMATGGIANIVHAIPFRFNGLYAIGCTFFLLNLVLFTLNVAVISLRFFMFPDTFGASFSHPTESLFVPSAIVSFGVILIGCAEYATSKTGPWFGDTMMVMFWIYCVMAVLGSCGIYLTLWSTRTFTIAQMTPIWIFPAYPLIIVGPMAGILVQHMSQSRALNIIICGVTLQGIGFMISIMVYSAYIYRLMTQKLPQESVRPGMFVSVGPSAFTVSGLITMAESANRALPSDFMGNGKMAAFVLKIIANWMGVWLWGLAVWFFFVSVGAHYSCVRNREMQFAMTWYSFIFPNTALAAATLAVGEAFSSHAINIAGTAMGIALVPLWAFVFCMMIRAVIKKQILWPQKGEDKDEGGWVRRPSSTASAL